MGTSYISRAELPAYGLPVSALATVPTDTQDKACESASRELDGRVAGRYGKDSLPFATWDTIITNIAGRIAAWHIAGTKGFYPGAAGGDSLLETNWKAAIKDCEAIQKQQLHPTVTFAPTKTVAKNQPVVLSSSVVSTSSGRTASNRGW